LTCSAARFRPATIGATRSATGPVMAAIEPMGTVSCANAGLASNAPMAAAESSFLMMALPSLGPFRALSSIPILAADDLRPFRALDQPIAAHLSGGPALSPASNARQGVFRPLNACVHSAT